MRTEGLQLGARTAVLLHSVYELHGDVVVLDGHGAHVNRSRLRARQGQVVDEFSTVKKLSGMPGKKMRGMFFSMSSVV
jgi:hypothetical protein